MIYFLTEEDKAKILQFFAIVENIHGPYVRNTPQGIFIGAGPGQSRKTTTTLEKTFLARVLETTGGPTKDDPDGRWKIQFEGVEPVITKNALTFEDASLQFKGYAFELNNRYIPAGTIIDVARQLVPADQQGKALDDDVWVRSLGEEWGDPQPGNVFSFVVDVGAGGLKSPDGQALSVLSLDLAAAEVPEDEVTQWTIEGQDTPAPDDKEGKLYRGVSATFLNLTYEPTEDDKFEYLGTGYNSRGTWDANGHLTKMDSLGQFKLHQKLLDGDNIWIWLNDSAPGYFEPENKKDGWAPPRTFPYYTHLPPDIAEDNDGDSSVISIDASRSGTTVTIELVAQNIALDKNGHAIMEAGKQTTLVTTFELPEPGGVDIEGDNIWIEVTTDDEDVVTVSHIGPDDPSSTETLGTASYDDVDGVLTIGGGDLSWDDMGHVTGFEPAEGGLKLQGDNIWTQLEAGGEGEVVISHIGPDEEGATSHDLENGASFAEGVLTIGGGALYWDDKGHVTKSEAGEGGLKLQGDGIWIDLEEDEDIVKINHALYNDDPDFESSVIYQGVTSVGYDTPGDFGDPHGIIFMGAKRYFDGAGHITSGGDPAKGSFHDYLFRFAPDGKWLQFQPVGGVDNENVEIYHIGPVEHVDNEKTAILVSQEVVTDGGAKKLRITFNKIQHDARGHFVEEDSPESDTVDLDVVEKDVITSWQVDGTNKKFQYKTTKVIVLAAESESSWIDAHTGTSC